MKTHISTFMLFLCVISAGAQSNHNDMQRLDFEPHLAPFYHGVASGDPLPDAVIIWTRVTTEEPSVTVSWMMATDTLFTNVVQSGTASTTATKDYTVKVDVGGLQPATYYYYQFELDGRKSLIGRTKTAPAGDNTHVRFALVSCANFENGYFNAYEHIAFRNDIDAVLHVGDYIYEYAVGGLPGSMAERPSEPSNEIITLQDYRVRYSHYHLDAQLRAVHQQYPFITVWDDHETANNSWFGGAENHTSSTEGDWFVRKNNGKQAYFEWLPVRESAVDSFRAYRKFNYGNLADILVLDTRLEGREEQGGVNNQDTNRTLLGHEQFQWLIANLDDTIAQWKMLAQQVMMAPLMIGSIGLNDDQWDGYPQERLKLFNHVLNNNIENFVVLTGDIHTSWANELKIPGLNNAGVEFVTTSITTTNAEIVGIPFNPASIFPHVKWADIIEHGYVIVDITTDRVQADWVFMNTVTAVDTSATVAASWYVNDKERTLNESQSSAPGLTNQAPLAPWTVHNPTGIEKDEQDVVIVGSYPNPFMEQIIIQYYLKNPSAVQVKIVDISGKIVLMQNLGIKQSGINYSQIAASALSPGNYTLILDNGSSIYHKKILKAN